MKKIKPKDNFVTYKSHKTEPYFSFIKNGQKTIEGRLRKGKYRRIKPGDHIMVWNKAETESLEVLVRGVRVYQSFGQMLEKEPLTKLLPNAKTVGQGLRVYRKFYTIEEEGKFGVTAVEMEKIKRTISNRKEREYFGIHEARYKFVLEKIVQLVEPGGKILDVGCYPTHMFEALKKRGWAVEGIASEFEKVEGTKILNIEKGRWPFEDKSFDLVLMTEIIEHLTADPAIWLKEAKRVLKPKGKILITTPNVVRLQNLAMMMMGKNIYFPLEQLGQNIYYRHNREYTLKELKGVLRKAELKVEAGFFIAYPPNRQKNKNDKTGLKIVKWVNYLVVKIWRKRQDSLWLVGYSR